MGAGSECVNTELAQEIAREKSDRRNRKRRNENGSKGGKGAGSKVRSIEVKQEGGIERVNEKGERKRG
eukprot:3874139-Pleurochrysis_carterae.AAC.1